jgi:hypothetical protein
MTREKEIFRLVREVMVLAVLLVGDDVSDAGSWWFLGVRGGEPFGLIEVGCFNLALGMAGSC